jgi:hypothetical protein
MKSLIPSGLMIVALAFSATGAVAADAHVTKVAHVVHASVHVAARRRLPVAQPTVNLGQIIASFLGGGRPMPYVSQYAGRVQNARGSADSYVSSPSFDSSPVVDTSSAATDSQAASDAEAQAIQSMNDTNALNASMAAAEQQNDAANAATLQTEINAGM